MAETPDISTQVYSQIRTKLEVYKPWANVIEVGNRIWYDDPDIGSTSPAKSNTADGDYPMSTLTLTGGAHNLFTNEVTFQTHSEEGPDHWLENSSYRFTLTMISKFMSIREIDRLGMLAVDAFRNAGPRLGLPFVVSVKVAWTTKETDYDAETELRRYKTEMNITVETELDGATLLGDPNG